MYRREKAFQPRLLAAVASWILLQAPAVWNGFPLLQYDTGGYLARWYEGTLVPSRAVVYGLILNASVPLSFWPVVAIQAALTVWVIALVLRAQGLGDRPWLLLCIVAALTVLSTLPWLTSILLTDIFAGLGVLALYLLLLRPGELTRRERFVLIAFVAVCAATHSATIAVFLALIFAAILVWFVRPKQMPLARIGNAFLALMLGALLVLAADYAVAKRLAWTPGGFALSFGRMLQDGIVKKYLDEHCPDPKLTLCGYKDQLPDDADVWFWGSPLFDKLGRFAGLGQEMTEITIASVVEYPGLQLRTVVADTAQQLVAVHTGEGVLNSIWHTYGIIQRFTPQLVTSMKAARQQQGEISFTEINRLHYPIALLSMILLPLVIVLAWRRTIPACFGELSAVCMIALLANAFVCGAMSNPHDRYGARIIWIAVFAVMVALVAFVDRLGSRSDIA
jgi:hypothetical protein